MPLKSSFARPPRHPALSAVGRHLCRRAKYACLAAGLALMTAALPAADAPAEPPAPPVSTATAQAGAAPPAPMPASTPPKAALSSAAPTNTAPAITATVTAADLAQAFDDLASPTAVCRAAALKTLEATGPADRPAILERYLTTDQLAIKKPLEQLLYRGILAPRAELDYLLKHPQFAAAQKQLTALANSEAPVEETDARIRKQSLCMMVILPAVAADVSALKVKIHLYNLYFERLADSPALAAQIKAYADILSTDDISKVDSLEHARAKIFYSAYISSEPYGINGLDEFQKGEFIFEPHIDWPAAAQLYSLAADVYDRLLARETDEARKTKLKSARDDARQRVVQLIKGPQPD